MTMSKTPSYKLPSVKPPTRAHTPLLANYYRALSNKFINNNTLPDPADLRAAVGVAEGGTMKDDQLGKAEEWLERNWLCD